MNDFDPDYLRQKLSTMSDEELYLIVNANAADYNEVAMSLAKDELSRRKSAEIYNIQDAKDKIKKKETQWNKEEGYTTNWLDYSVVSYFMGMILSLLYTIFLIMWSDKDKVFLYYILSYVITAGLICGFLSIGLRNRRLWAWKLNNIFLLLYPLSCFIGALTKDLLFFKIHFFIGIIWSPLNYIYFAKRRSLFS